jgi:tetratricopeptide (TPR) repeat protein
MRKPVAALLVLVLAVGGIAGLKLRAERTIERAKVPGGSIIYLPSGKFLRYAALGYTNLAADLIFLWAIQYFSNTAVPARFRYLDHVFAVIAELDPLFIDPYEIGALIAVADGGDPDTAFSILDRGLAKNPDQWLFPYEAGHLAQLSLKDYELARRYYQKVMDIPGSPEIAKRLYANAAYKEMNYELAWESWMEVYRTAKDDRTRKFAENHLYQVKATVDMKALMDIAAKFKERAGRFPADLAELVRVGLAREIPKDYDGGDYVYDPATGKVSPPKSPWKR